MPVGTPENPSPLDPFDKLEPDEPYFRVRGKDPAGCGTVTEWARITRTKALAKFGPEPKTERDKSALKAVLAKCAQAEELAFIMQEYAEGHERPGDTRATYNELQQTEEHLAEVQAKRRLEGLMRHMQEGRYHICEAKDGLVDMLLLSEETNAEIDAMLERLGAIANEFDPRSQFHAPRLPV